MAIASASADAWPRDEGAQEAARRLVVNKRDLAKQVLNCSLPCLNDLIDRYPDFPVVERGSLASAWQFDAAEVVAFLGGKREAERQDAETRADLFRQFTLPIDSIAGDQQTGLAPSQRLAAARARMAERQLAIETGMLLQGADVRQMLQSALTRLGRFLENLPAEIERRFNLPAEVSLAMRDRIDEARAEFVAQVKPYLTE